MIEAAAMVDVPEDTVKAVVLSEEERLKKEAGFKSATFPGQRNVGSYIYDNMSNMAHETNTCVRVSFQINEKGVLHDALVVNGADYELDAEIIRILKDMPLWTPATQDGKPVNCYWTYTYCD